MFEKEAQNLKLLKENAEIYVPDVIETGQYNDLSYLILEWIEPGKSNPATNDNLAHQLVILHNTHVNSFGLNYNNYIGSLPQDNTEKYNWLEFYFINRIEYQLKIAIDAKLMKKTSIKKTETMFSNVEKDFPDVVPSLLHGDLWSGNFMINKSGNAAFIDPAVYYGYREMDIAMMKLFGGFSSDVYYKYNEQLPMDHDWNSRLRFNQLYYILVHVNLFGGNYVNLAESIINYYSS
jgi:fructosamine-3-kinase